MKNTHDGININTISGGIVNFGGAIKISPISITINGTTSSGLSASFGRRNQNPNLTLS